MTQKSLHTHTYRQTARQPDSQTARQAGLVSYTNATFTDLLSWLPTRPTRDTLPSRTTDTQDVLLHDICAQSDY
ncbi:hypothetical protein M433DRAFT_9672 [Acidomyces richmondensis BFW]|nr:hypothetical protein M433DRAFT_9672 [Acidomyces richmondensis BFW]